MWHMSIFEIFQFWRRKTHKHWTFNIVYKHTHTHTHSHTHTRARARATEKKRSRNKVFVSFISLMIWYDMIWYDDIYIFWKFQIFSFHRLRNGETPLKSMNNRDIFVRFSFFTRFLGVSHTPRSVSPLFFFFRAASYDATIKPCARALPKADWQMTAWHARLGWGRGEVCLISFSIFFSCFRPLYIPPIWSLFFDISFQLSLSLSL